MPTFTTPTSYGYLYLGIRVDPPRRAPFVRRSAKRAEVLRECVAVAARLTALPEVVAATVYEAVLIPPVPDSPRFDVLVLVRTTSEETIPAVQASEAVRSVRADLVMAARNLRRIGDTDHPDHGHFLFNHFTSADAERALATWEEVTRWFTDEAGVDNSTLLRPTGPAPYVFVNHVRLPCGPVRFLLRFTRPSFRRVVARRLAADGIGNAPVFCRPV